MTNIFPPMKTYTVILKVEVITHASESELKQHIHSLDIPCYSRIIKSIDIHKVTK
jgi:hypothetical protein